MKEANRSLSPGVLDQSSVEIGLPPEIDALADHIKNDRHLPPISPAILERIARLRDKRAWQGQPSSQIDLWKWVHSFKVFGKIAGMPVTDTEWENDLRGCWIVCKGFPRGVWSTEAQAELLRRTAFWPSPKVLYDTLLPFAEAIQLADFKLKRIQQHAARAAAAAADTAARDADAERLKAGDPAVVSAHVQDAVRSLAVPRGPYQTAPVWPDPGSRPTARPAFLSRRQLTVAYRDLARTEATRVLREAAALRLSHLLPGPEQPTQAPTDERAEAEPAFQRAGRRKPRWRARCDTPRRATRTSAGTLPGFAKGRGRRAEHSVGFSSRCPSTLPC